MHILYKILLVIHISAAAVTLGGSTGLMRNLRRTLEAGKEAFSIAAEDAMRRGKIMGISSLVLLLTGLALIFTIGGFAVAPLNIHIALGIMLLAFAISATIMRPNSAKLVQLSQAASLDKPAIRQLFKKLAMGQGMLHLAWLVILILMLVRIEK